MSDIPQVAKAIFEQACTEIQEGALDRAVESFTACIEIVPQQAGLYRGRATAHFEMRNWKAAQSDFRRGIEFDSEDPENWIGLGMSLAMDLQILAGIEVIESYLQKHPEYMRAYLTMGLLYLRMGVRHKARECLQRALKMNPPWEERRLIEIQLKIQENDGNTNNNRSDIDVLKQNPKT